MGIRKYKPTTPGRRGSSVADFVDVTRSTPEKSLVRPLPKKGGLEGAPRGIDARELGRRLAEMPGVVEVHDLHVWTITSGFPALAAHVLVERGDDCHARRRELEDLLVREYGI